MVFYAKVVQNDTVTDDTALQGVRAGDSKEDED